MVRLFRFVVWFAAVAACFGFQSAPAKRHAILIGAGDYRSLPKISASAANVAALAEALTGAEFAISSVSNPSLETIDKARDAFLSSVKPGDVVLIYYSGYAIQVNGENFMLPVDFNPATSLDDIPYKAQSFTALLQQVNEQKPGLKILVVDAPWQVSARFSALGLSTPDPRDTRESLIAFSNQPGQVLPLPTAAGAATMFTSRVAESIRKPGVLLDDVFLNAQREVNQTNPQQRPYVLPNVSARFFFRQPIEDPTVKVKHIYRRNRRDRQEYVLIRPDAFLMGCVPADTFCEDNERPQHQVTLSKAFWMGSAEVDIQAYSRFVAEDTTRKRRMPGEAPMWDRKRAATNHPIGGSTWEDAVEFCKWVGGRLPTEAEWEYAARAGKKNEIWPLNDENSREKANFYGIKGNDRSEYTAPVKSYDPNGFGLYDMAGNLWEWVSDWYSEKYFASSPELDPQGPSSGSKHVRRGGSFDSDPKKHLRISIRRPGDKGNNVGFRCVLNYTPETEKLFEPQ